MEVLAFLELALVSWIAVGIFLTGVVITESDGVFWPVAFSIGLVYSLVKLLGVNLTGTEIGFIALAYIPIGLAWSVWRYRIYVMRIMKDLEREKITSTHRLEINAPDNMIPSFVAWTLVWPVSMVSNVFGDLMIEFKTFISTKMIGFYNKIYDNAIYIMKDKQ